VKIEKKKKRVKIVSVMKTNHPFELLNYITILNYELYELYNTLKLIWPVASGSGFVWCPVGEIRP